MESSKSADQNNNGSIYVFLLPSLLDLAGTIVDTAGLFYVLFFLKYRQAFQ